MVADATLESVAEKFGHVRVFLDPLVAGSVNASGIYEYPNSTNVSPAMDSFLNFVDRCKKLHIPVVVNFFPFWISQRHFDWVVLGQTAPEPFPQVNSKAYKIASPTPGYFNTPRPYLAPWRKQYAMYETATLDAPNHPLVKTWRELTKIFSDRGFGRQDVTFSIMGEPQVGFSQPRYFLAADWPMYSSEQTRRDKWRAIQLEAVKAIRANENPLMRFRVMVTSNESFPHSFVHTNPAPLLNEPPYNSSMFPKYTSQEVVAADDLIYTFHLYAPYRFTHPQDAANEDQKNYYNPAYDLGAAYQIYIEPETSTRNDYSKPLSPVTTSPHDDANSGYHRLRMKQYLALMNHWSALEWPAIWPAAKPYSNAIVMAEFGAFEQKFTCDTPAEPDPTSGEIQVGIQCLHSLPYMNADKLKMRARWTYDARKLAENRRYGWTYWDLSSGFRAFEGSMIVGNPTVPAPTAPTDYLPGFESALFGTRP